MSQSSFTTFSTFTIMKASFIALFPLLLVQTAFAQLGSITAPPDSPAPQRLTLAELQPRIPLIVGQPGVTFEFDEFKINQPGNYYLTADVTMAINIRANDVVIDLNGFTILFAPNSATRGIYANSTRQGVQVRNGNLSNCGIELLGPDPVVTDCLVENASGTGIDAPLGRVERCLVDGTGMGNNGLPLSGAGISATIVEDCIAQKTWLAGIMVTVTEFVNSPNGAIYHHQGADGGVRRCYGQCIGQDPDGKSGEVSGIFADKATVEDSAGISSEGSLGGTWNAPTAVIRGATVQNCKGSSEGGIGISGGSVQNCTGTCGNTDSGVGVGANSASECAGISITTTTASGQRSYGIRGNHIINCVGSGTSTGIYCTGITTYCQATRAGGGIAIQGIIVTGCTTLQGGTVGQIDPGYYDGVNLTAPPLQKFLGTL